MNLQSQVDRGQQAERLLRDPLLQEAFLTVEQAIHEQWAQSPMRDVEGQLALRAMLNHLRDVRSVIEVALADGKAAADELKRINSKVLTPREFFGHRG